MIMKQFRQRDNLRYISSFLLALLLHSLLLIVGYNTWGQPTNQLQITKIYSRLVEVESPQYIKTEPRPNPLEGKTSVVENTEKETSPHKSGENHKPREDNVEKKAQTTEVSQEKFAPREVPPAEEELSPKEHKEIQKPIKDSNMETEPQVEPTPPPLPPLGNGLGMLLTHRTFYPKDLLNKGIEGVVRMEITIDVDGNLLKEPEITRSSGIPKLDEHCVLTIKRIWKFKPAPKPYKLSVELRFTKDEVEDPLFLKEATYLSPEEGGTSE